MKCPECDGVGRIHYGEEWCSACNGTGEIVTNDEWRKTCSAEEFAEFLCNVGFANETIVRKFKSEWVEWLKQPHTSKE